MVLISSGQRFEIYLKKPWFSSLVPTIRCNYVYILSANCKLRCSVWVVYINTSMREMLVYNHQWVNDKVEVVSLSQGVIFEVQSQEMMQRKLFLFLPLSPVNWGLLMEFIPPICLHLCGKHLRTCRINHSTINNAPCHWYSGQLLNWCKEHSYHRNFKLGITEGNTTIEYISF